MDSIKTSEVSPKAVNDAIAALQAAGIPSAMSDVAALLDAVARESGDEARFLELGERRRRREPLAHLTGEVEFRGLRLQVGPGVFVPQPETESVVQWAVDWLSDLQKLGVSRPRVVDLCTGSGTVALAVADGAPWAEVHAVEIDPDAFRWAQRNVACTGVDVTLHLADARDAFPHDAGTFDLVVSNPPYVAARELAHLNVEVGGHDPQVALFAGADGLDLIRLVEQSARRLLRPGGCVVVEHSDRQGLSAPAVFAAAGAWTDIADHRDHEGLDRFVTALHT
jgi:release factor glutamine methyltransferase